LEINHNRGASHPPPKAIFVESRGIKGELGGKIKTVTPAGGTGKRREFGTRSGFQGGGRNFVKKRRGTTEVPTDWGVGTRSKNVEENRCGIVSKVEVNASTQENGIEDSRE